MPDSNGDSKQARTSRRRAPEQLGPGGPNPLFFGVVASLAAGIAAGFLARDDDLFGSTVVSPLFVGALVAGLAYVAVAALWFAWHRRVFKRMTAGPASIEPPDQGVGEEIRERDEEITDFMENTTNAIEDLDRRVQRIEDALREAERRRV